MSLPQGIDLAQYKTQARELLTQVRAAQPEALDRLQRHHPEYEPLAAFGSIGLADTQLVLARENGFPSWPKFKDYLVFRNAVQALDAGDLPRLEALLDKHPSLVRYHCRVGAGYETGYFAGATLLNHIAGNPIRGPLPSNILDIARLLLRCGARDAPPNTNHTLGLLLTSKQASEAGVALPLIDLLLAAKAIDLDLTDPDLLSPPLRNDALVTAQELVRRGARMDIRHASALGRLDLVRQMITNAAREEIDASLVPLPYEPTAAKAQKEEAFLWACRWGRTEIADFLLEQGVDPSAQANTGQTGLHTAAHRGHLDTVKRLLARNAPLEVKNRYGGTVLGQAVWSALYEPQAEHLSIIESLLAAGANMDAVGYPTGNARLDDILRRHGAKS
jgi:hypothetical protein